MKERIKSKSSGEWTSIIKNKKVLIPVIAVALIPLLYSFMFLWAFWDPYAKLNELPVAVVNNDKGAVFNDKELAVGNEFINKLKETNDFKYDFVSMNEANDGLNNQKYYMAIEIPEDFSVNATKAMDKQPVQPELKYVANESLNFLSSQIGKSAIEKMKSELTANMVKAYTDTIFDNLDELSDGMQKASDGAKELADGTKQAKDGINEIDLNLGKLTEGTKPLQEGVKGLVDGASQLVVGSGDLHKGTSQLAGGLDQLNAGGSQLTSSAKQLEAASGQLNEGLKSSVAGSEKLQAGAQGIQAALQGIAQAQPELAQTAEFKQLLEAAKQLSGGATASLEGQKQLSAGMQKLSDSQGQFVAGLSGLSSKLGEAAQGMKVVDAGASTLSTGLGQLNAGLAELSGGVDQISSGSAQLKEGTLKLSEGMGTVTDGTNELSSKLKEAADKTGEFKPTEANKDAISSPIELVTEGEGIVPNYGTGFSPYFLSLGLFVGALTLTIVYPLKKPAIEPPRSSFHWFISKFGTILVIGAIQALLASFIMLVGLDLEVKSVWKFIVMGLATSWCFMAILQFLVTAFADAGRFMAIVLLIIQLTTSAGTFPLELIPDSLQVFNKLVPMTYSVSGYKAVISSGQFDVMWQNIAVLAGIIVVMGGLTWAVLQLSFKRNYRSGSTVQETATV